MIRLEQILTPGRSLVNVQIAAMLDRADVRDRLRSAPTAEALYQIVVDVQNGQ